MFQTLYEHYGKIGIGIGQHLLLTYHECGCERCWMWNGQRYDAFYSLQFLLWLKHINLMCFIEQLLSQLIFRNCQRVIYFCNATFLIGFIYLFSFWFSFFFLVFCWIICSTIFVLTTFWYWFNQTWKKGLNK